MIVEIRYRIVMEGTETDSDCVRLSLSLVLLLLDSFVFISPLL